MPLLLSFGHLRINDNLTFNSSVFFFEVICTLSYVFEPFKQKACTSDGRLLPKNDCLMRIRCNNKSGLLLQSNERSQIMVDIMW